MSKTMKNVHESSQGNKTDFWSKVNREAKEPRATKLTYFDAQLSDQQ